MITLVVFMIFLKQSQSNLDSVFPYDLPIFPAFIPKRNYTEDKLIPRDLWIAVKDIEKESDMNYQLPKLFERNKSWRIHVVDNYHKTYS